MQFKGKLSYHRDDGQVASPTSDVKTMLAEVPSGKWALVLETCFCVDAYIDGMKSTDEVTDADILRWVLSQIGFAKENRSEHYLHNKAIYRAPLEVALFNRHENVDAGGANPDDHIYSYDVKVVIWSNEPFVLLYSEHRTKPVELVVSRMIENDQFATWSLPTSELLGLINIAYTERREDDLLQFLLSKAQPCVS